MTSGYAMFDFVGTWCTKNFGRDIVDKHGFLLHEGKTERAFKANESKLICDVWLTMVTTFIKLF